MGTSLQKLSTHVVHMELSSVIPVRIGSKSLRCCLEALKASTGLTGGMIVGDNPSTDTSAATGEAYYEGR